MKCSKCGQELASGAKFCVKCGEPIETKEKTKTSKKEENKNSGFEIGTTILGCLMFILNVILKPVSTLKAKLNNYSNIKTAGVLVILVAIARMIINLIGAMINAIFTKKISNYWSGESKLSIDFENLKDLDYLSLIFKQLFGFIIVVCAIAGIYYIVALIMKKTSNYFKLVTITTVSFIPFIIVSSLISIIISYIYAPLSYFLIIGSFIYSFLTFVGACDDELDIDDSNLKVYFHSICLTVVFIVFYYIAINSLGNQLSSMLK